jgi:Fic family protein
VDSISQKFRFYDDPVNMEPLLPGDHVLGGSLELAHDLQHEAHRLTGACQDGVAQELRALLRQMNSYYSNKIEGQHTLPTDIQSALGNDYSDDADKARRQRLAIAHIRTEEWIEAQQAPLGQLYSAAVVRVIHQHLFEQLPPEDRVLGDGSRFEPGELRRRNVSVGRHAAPAHPVIDAMLQRWARIYAGVRRGEMQVVAAAASHHRLAWVHPFLDGNGRVARLHTHAVFECLKLTGGLWSPLRGFARTQEQYYLRLAEADMARAGDLDGRGTLTQRGLVQWIDYMLGISLDQVRFMSAMLKLDAMKDRIDACLTFEENVVKQGVRREALRPLHYLFAAQGDIERADFKAMTGLGDRVATSLTTALLKRGLLKSDSPYGKLRFAVPLHALRFYFPSLWPEAEAAAQ